jgi:hypothetical protein
VERSPLFSIHHPPYPPISYVTKIKSERNDTSSVAKTLIGLFLEETGFVRPCDTSHFGLKASTTLDCDFIAPIKIEYPNMQKNP